MVENIVQEPLINGDQLPYKSLGILIFEKLRQRKDVTLLREWEGLEVSSELFLKWTVNLAKNLKNFGIRKDDVITIVSHNNVNSLVTMVAGFYVGAKVNLLNHDYTSRELKKLLDITRPVLIFCIAKALPNILELKADFNLNIVLYDDESFQSEVIHFNHFLENFEDESEFTPLDLDIKEDVALILTSSGTTGFPKCVQLTHASFRIAILFATSPNFFDINKNSTILGYLPAYHIYGAFLNLASILSGAKLILLKKFIPDVFLKVIEEYRITNICAVPPILVFLVKSPLVNEYDMSSLECIFCGASPVTKEFEDLVEKKLNVTIRQLYGLTECGGVVTCTPKDLKKIGSVGKVAPRFDIKVCDTKTGKKLSHNEVGEIRIKGDSTMKNYLGNEKQTQEAFDDEGYLFSGDLGFFDEDGFFYVVDRLKELIKYKGFQVAPAEIESLLLQHPSVKDVGVVGKFDERVGEVTVAFVVKQKNFEVTEDDLVKYVAENLSIQKHLHGGVRFINEIPKSANGKILRRKLRDMLLDEIHNE